MDKNLGKNRIQN